MAGIGPCIYILAVPVFLGVHNSRGASSLGCTSCVILILTRAAVAQLAARRSHNPKVVSSILTCRSWGTGVDANSDWQQQALAINGRCLLGRVLLQLLSPAHAYNKGLCPRRSIGVCAPAGLHRRSQEHSCTLTVGPYCSVSYDAVPALSTERQ